MVFSIILGLIMHFIFRKEELERQGEFDYVELQEERGLWQRIVYFALMILILIALTWAKPGGPDASAFMTFMFTYKWMISGILAFGLGLSLVFIYGFKLWKVLFTALVVTAAGMLFPEQPLIAYITGLIMFIGFLSKEKGELKDWLDSSWSYTKLILPLLFVGVMIAGSLLGRPGHEAWIPSYWIETAVGGNSLGANFFASISGAFMYFATLTEVPILQGLLGSGMGKGPALALLLSGPALSLPSMLVINTVLGLKKTSVFIALVVIMSTITGYFFGAFFG